MKKITSLLILCCLFVIIPALQAQLSSAKRDQLKSTAVPKPLLNQKGTVGIGQLPVNPIVYNKATLEDPLLMVTRYDLQSNASSENRIHLFPDGTVGACAMLSHDNSFSDRGTGLNYFDGTNWGLPPSTRIESSKAGWPSYAPLGPDGEIVVTHHNLDGLIIMTRATKGTGSWNESILPGPAGAVDISWPRVVTNGPDNTYIHIICVTYSVYQNLDPYALLYYRSLDGGATWDYQHRIIEGMTSADYLGFSADMYAWAQPVGNTLAFVFGDSWMDLAVMKSTNNGDDWEKIVVWPSQWNTTDPTGEVEIFLAPDGTVACALDKYGKAHVVSGLVYASADATGSKQWVPKSDGVIYWNEDKPQLPEVLDWDELYNNGTMIGWVTDTNVFEVEDSRIAFYYNSMTSQPTICVDDDDFVFVMWSGMTMNEDPDTYLLRHIFARGSSDHGNTWTTSIVDLTSDYILYTWSECTFPSVSFTSDDNVYLAFMEDGYAGVSLNSTNPGYQGQTSILDNNIRVLSPSKMDILAPVGVEQQAVPAFVVEQNVPNPVQDQTTVKVTLTRAGSLDLKVSTVTGQQVMNLSKGQCAAGNHTFTLDTRNLKSGIYFYTVTSGKDRVTKKMVVQ